MWKELPFLSWMPWYFLFHIIMAISNDAQAFSVSKSNSQLNSWDLCVWDMAMTTELWSDILCIVTVHKILDPNAHGTHLRLCVTSVILPITTTNPLNILLPSSVSQYILSYWLSLKEKGLHTFLLPIYIPPYFLPRYMQIPICTLGIFSQASPLSSFREWNVYLCLNRRQKAKNKI